MEDVFKIYVEQLRDGRTEEIEASCPSNFLDVNDHELVFKGNVDIEGQAYLADDNLILHLKIAAHAAIPCSICNGPVDVEINIPNFYHMEPLAEIKTGIFDFTEVLREAILLEVPPFGECHGGVCPEREKLAKYLKVKSAGAPSGLEEEEGYQPFADIDLDKYKPSK